MNKIDTDIYICIHLERDQYRLLEKLLPIWQGYAAYDGSYPYKDYTVADLFQFDFGILAKKTIQNHVEHILMMTERMDHENIVFVLR